MVRLVKLLSFLLATFSSFRCAPPPRFSLDQGRQHSLPRAVLKRVSPTRPLFFALATAGFVSFYMAQWEEYHTHVMELGFIGVTEANVRSFAVFRLSASFASYSFYAFPRLAT
jgi:hypothetical protein